MDGEKKNPQQFPSYDYDYEKKTEKTTVFEIVEGFSEEDFKS